MNCFSFYNLVRCRLIAFFWVPFSKTIWSLHLHKTVRFCWHWPKPIHRVFLTTRLTADTFLIVSALKMYVRFLLRWPVNSKSINDKNASFSFNRNRFYIRILFTPQRVQWGGGGRIPLSRPSHGYATARECLSPVIIVLSICKNRFYAGRFATEFVSGSEKGRHKSQQNSCNVAYKPA